MLLTSLPFEYARLADGRDRVESPSKRPRGTRIRRPGHDKD